MLPKLNIGREQSHSLPNLELSHTNKAYIAHLLP
jgi:hypothetical protein